jgi:hypothetical protein
MSEYIGKINNNDAPCCESANDIPVITGWTYDPEGTDGSVERVENTKHFGSINKYARIWGSNLIDSNGAMKGTLTPAFNCTKVCDYSAWLNNFSPLRGDNNSYGLRAIQINGLAGSALYGEPMPTSFNQGLFNTTRSSVAFPIGESIQIQIFGGIGNVRTCWISRPKVVEVDQNIIRGPENYEPIMEYIGPEQVRQGDFKVDQGFNSPDAFIFTLTTVGQGKSLVRFVDEANCAWEIGIHVFPKLCSISAKGKQKNFKSNIDMFELEGADLVLSGKESSKTIRSEKQELCSCDFEDIEADEKVDSVDVPWHFCGNDLFFPNIMSDLFSSKNSISYSGPVTSSTRYMNYKGNLMIRQALTLQVGETYTYDSIQGQEDFLDGKNKFNKWTVRSLGYKASDGGNGIGWDSDNFGPIWKSDNSSRITNFIEAKNIDRDSFQIKCNAPTNYLPELLIFEPSGPNGNDTALGPLIPMGDTNLVFPVNGAGDIATYTSWEGVTTGISLFPMGNANRPILTTFPFVIAVHCLCGKVSGDMSRQQKKYAHGDELDYPDKNNLPFDDKWKHVALDPESLGEEEQNLNGSVLKKVGKKMFFSDENNSVKSTNFTVFGQALWFGSWSTTVGGDSPLYVGRRIPMIEDNLITAKDHEFFEKKDHNSLGDFKFKFQGMTPWEGYKESFLGEQPRGSWCIHSKAIDYSTSAPIPIINKDKNSCSPSLIKSESKDIIVIDGSDEYNNKPFKWNTN